MDTKNQQNSFNNPVVIILVLALIGLGGYVIFSKKSNNDLENKTSETIVDLQAKCATQAQKTLNNSIGQYTNDGWDGSTGEPASTRTNFTQTNHYNQKLNKCFVLTKYDFTYAGTLNEHFITTGETLFDAFQNDELASCIHSHRLSYDKFPEQYTDTCLIGQGNGLTSLENYNSFVNEKMELGK